MSSMTSYASSIGTNGPNSNSTLTSVGLNEDMSTREESVYSPASICEENFAPAEDFKSPANRISSSSNSVTTAYYTVQLQ